MEKSIIENLKKVLSKDVEIGDDVSQLVKFEKASAEFNKLVENGLVEKRGYSLQTVDQMAHVKSNYKSNS